MLGNFDKKNSKIMFAALMKLGFHSASSSAPAVPECCMLICAGLFIGGICELVTGPGDNFAARNV